ncbi:MAG TPA: DNA-directed RNA polymerase subunit alpha [Gemmatimonadota bacterium]|nr:DNA-directed RNA polymerase subunit alpha [Gemmatimonadota bacterium]
MVLENFILPRRVEKDTGSLSGTYGEFHIQPLERGFGLTLGNAIRRVLLSSLEGSAVWGVRIDNVLHEFSTIRGSVHDTSEVVMNLKRLVLRLAPEITETALHLRASKRGDITAADFEDNPQVEILNPDLLLLTLDEDKKLDMEVFVKGGRGYVPADQHESERLKEIGFIAVDSIFSPVVRANFQVENTRVGRRTDYDRLTLEVTTNGAVDPEVAIAQAAEILRTHFQYFLAFEEPDEELEGELEEKHNRLKELFARPVDDLELSVRSNNCLKSSNIRTLGDLVQKSESQMLQYRNFGKKSLNEIADVLQRHGLHFGMSVKGSPEAGYVVLDREELRRLPEIRLDFDEDEELEGSAAGDGGGEE